MPREVTIGERVLHVHDHGDPAGPAIVVHHGTPMAGRPFAAWADDAAQRGARLVGYDRPGYGRSAPDPGRTVAAAAADVAAILDALGIERCVTWGISGGGPHALACAALLGDRVAAAASLGGVAPFEAPGLNYFAGMGADNHVEFGAALMGRETLEPFLSAAADGMRDITADGLTEGMATLLCPPDEVALRGPLGGYLSDLMRVSLAGGADGWVDDDLAFVAPFGFEHAAVTVPILVWHGEHDRFVPVAHGRWLAATIPGAEARISADDGHLTLLAERIPDVHAWLLARL